MCTKNPFFFYLHKFSVLPDTLKIRVEPKILTVGTEATLFCDSSSSNPAAKLTWWKDGIPVEGLGDANQAGLWGGMISSTTLKINMTQDMNDVKYTCQGTNEALQRSVNEVVSLQVLCKYLLLLTLICVYYNID